MKLIATTIVATLFAVLAPELALGQSPAGEAVDAALQQAESATEQVESKEPASTDENEGAGKGAAFDAHVSRQASLELQLGLRLYEEYDDYRAISALKRYEILENTPQARLFTNLITGQIYHRNEKPQLSALAFERAAEASGDPGQQAFAYLLGLQELCLPLSYYIACRGRLQEFAQTRIPASARDIADYQLLYTDVVLRSEYVSRQRADVFKDPKLKEKALDLIAADKAFAELDLQSPWLAGILSGLLPGAGQAYNGRWADGVVSLAFVGLFGAATWYSFARLDSVPLGIFSGFLAAGFYSGGIYNAVSDANRINAARYLEFFEDLKRLWPRVTFAITGNSVTFGYAFDWPGPTLESETRDALDAEEARQRAADGEQADRGSKEEGAQAR